VTVECDAVPDPATPGATDNCDPNPVISFLETSTKTNTGACTDFSYTITRTWTAKDACNNSSSQTQTITVVDTTPPTISGAPQNVTVECDNVPGVDVVTAVDNCDPNPVVTEIEVSTQTNTGACTDFSYTLTRTWTAVDACGNQAMVNQVITVQDTQPPDITPPADESVFCGDPIDFGDPTVTDNCDGNPTVVIVSTVTTQLQTGEKEHVRTWYAIDACGNQSGNVSQTITESRCQYFSLTQGAYGSVGGAWCGVGHPGTLAMIQSLLGTDIYIGLPGHSLTITYADANCVITALPGNGGQFVLPAGNGTFNSSCGTTTNIPVNKQGRFKNNFLTQTITLALNIRLDPGLGTFWLPPSGTPYLRTEGSDYVNGICGDGDDIGSGSFANFYIPTEVLTYLGSTGSNKTVNDLLALANTALGNGSIGTLTLAQISDAVAAFNEGFDNARYFAGYYVTPPPKWVSPDGVPADFVLFQNHPNPFNPSTTIEFQVSEPSVVRLAVYNSLGAEVAVLIDGPVPAGLSTVVWNTVNTSGSLPSGLYTYRMEAKSETGKEFVDVKKMMLVR